MTPAHQLPAPAGRDDRTIFLRISGHLAGETEPQSALAAVAGEIRAVLPFTHADICLLDSPGWSVSYEVGIKTRWSLKRTRLQYSPVREVLMGRVPYMLTPNAMEDDRYTFPGARCEPIFQHKLRSRINVPMKVMGRVIGTLNISHSEVGLYSEATVAEVQHLADVLAPYFQALRTAEKARQSALVRAEVQAREEGLRQGALELTEALERERQRIGMDLHDQTLADLSRLLRDVTSEGPLPPRDELARRIGDCIDDLRRIIDTAVPTLLELFGFAHAIRVHLERAVGAEPIAIEVDDLTEGAADALPSNIRTALFRIAQEAINNAARHSGARRITVEIGRKGHTLCLTVRDDGRGLSEGRRQSGLMHMRTRARLIGADLDIVGNEGTTVAVTLAGKKRTETMT